MQATVQKNSIENGYEGLVQSHAKSVQSLSLTVGGIYCAACIQKIESTLKHHQQVEEARLNFSTGKLHIVWSGAADLANSFVDEIEVLGYEVYPYDPDIEKDKTVQTNKFLLLCMAIAGFAAGNLMLLSIGLWITDPQSMGTAMRDFLNLISALIALPAIVFAGRPFFKSALRALSAGHANMDVPISLALILASGMSVVEMLMGGAHVYFDSAVMLMFFLLVGRYLDFRARQSARGAAQDLAQKLAGFATVLENGKPKRMHIRDISEEARIQVNAGEKIPLDGVIEKGISTVDTSLITGETLPQSVSEGANVYAGMINLAAPLVIRVEKEANDTVLADIIALMEQAEQGQARYVRLADRAAQFYTPVVHLMALCAFVLWWGLWDADWQDALLTAVTVLIITCPCALGLAVPVVQVLASGLLMKRGVYLKAGDALERLATINRALFDKTGTLTYGRPELTGAYEQNMLCYGASLAQYSTHPLSRALARQHKGPYLEITDVKEHPGKGLEGIIDDKVIRLGNRPWCGVSGNEEEKEYSELWLRLEGQSPQFFSFEDKVRAGAQQVIFTLKAQNVEVTLLSGDRQGAVKKAAQITNIGDWHAQQSPVDKHVLLEEYKAKGDNVLMVGDGLNDAPVLAAAHVSMAPGSALDIAQSAADIVYLGNTLAPVGQTYVIAKQATRLVRQNFALTILYNLIAIPLAFSGMVTPMIAALAMSGSSLLVIANSFRLKFMA